MKRLSLLALAAAATLTSGCAVEAGYYPPPYRVVYPAPVQTVILAPPPPVVYRPAPPVWVGPPVHYVVPGCRYRCW